MANRKQQGTPLRVALHADIIEAKGKQPTANLRIRMEGSTEEVQKDVLTRLSRKRRLLDEPKTNSDGSIVISLDESTLKPAKDENSATPYVFTRSGLGLIMSSLPENAEIAWE